LQQMDPANSEEGGFENVVPEFSNCSQEMNVLNAQIPDGSEESKSQSKNQN
jgi:hypothetical protein